MHIGVDFDNTIVSYDELFHRAAVDSGLIPSSLPHRKVSVRSHLRSQPDGENQWIRLQSVVYGSRIMEATLCEGFDLFATHCRNQGIRMSVISHKLQYPALGPRIDLREAAIRWMRQAPSRC